MTDDIVARLRSSANVFYEYAADNGAFLREAADRIDELETALREIAEGPLDADKSYVSLIHELQSKARAALAGEKTDD